MIGFGASDEGFRSLFAPLPEGPCLCRCRTSPLRVGLAQEWDGGSVLRQNGRVRLQEERAQDDEGRETCHKRCEARAVKATLPSQRRRRSLGPAARERCRYPA